MNRFAVVVSFAVNLAFFTIGVAASSATPQVITTVAPITNIVSNIGGDRIEAIGIVPEGVNSHTFEPRPSDVELLSEADLIIANGLFLEEPILNLARASKPDETKIVLLGDETISRDEWVFDFSFPESGGKPNPHLWVNPLYAMAYAELVATALQELDPSGRDYYARNLNLYLAQLEALDRVTREVVASIPVENRKLLTYHDSWAYWGREYGIEILGAIQPSDLSEPSAREVAEIVDRVRETGVPAIFGSEVFPSRIAAQIARETGVKLDNTSDDDLPGEGNANAVLNDNPEHTYVGMMAENLRIFAKNLGGDTSAIERLDVRNPIEAVLVEVLQEQ
ncbi:metal ABC transporter substrate-binding protein [Synechococcus sp. PCC 7336]|uniref:metal ABC transporter substrate-binding protein n=1 Tax=Synechococcus sp. PCC 7336 TaxID=195250 RepID=UPI0003462322|nr:metal ABC transporter substrate-binding protein [Synechococcus sp. PCC 7336]